MPAITFDAASEAHSTAVTSITKAHTCSGANRLLVAFGFVNLGYSVNSITYNGDALTAIQTITNATDTIRSFYKIAPATGSNNAVVTFSAAGSGSCIAMESINGAKQSAQPDATASQTPVSASPMTTTITIVAPGSWVVIAGRDSSSGGSAASTNCTDRGLSQDQLGMFDSGAGQGAGSFGMTMTSGLSIFSNMVSFAPIPAPKHFSAIAAA